jgi:hypothetical protein
MSGMSMSPAAIAMMMQAQQQQQAQQQLLLQQQMMLRAGGAAPQMMMPNAPMPNARKQRELYIGNLPPGLTEPMMRELYTQLIQECDGFNAALGPAVINVQLCGGGTYAFVEFRDEELAETAMQFTGMMILGKPLKINRPNGYVPTPTPVRRLAPPASLLEKFGLSASGAGGAPGRSIPGGDNRKARELYVGNLAVGVVSAAMLKELFTAPLLTLAGGDAKDSMPPVIDARLDAGGKFAFLEFRDETLTTTALSLFARMELCGRPMQVARPSGYVAPQLPETAAAFAGGAMPLPSLQSSQAVGAQGGLMGEVAVAASSSDAGGGGAGVGGEAAASSSQIGSGTFASPVAPSCSLRLENLLDESVMLNDAEFTEVVEDIRTEISRFGEVASFVVPRRHALHGLEPTDVGKCFVRYESVASASRAFESLNGRDFDGNKVCVVFLSDA